MMGNYDPNMGHKREEFTPPEQYTRTKGKCLPPCTNTIYDVKFEKWHMGGGGKSLQIAFSDFIIVSREEYPACEWTCIIGELGGNLGFFLGGSIILAYDLILDYGLKLGRFIRRKLMGKSLADHVSK